jgi:hypothetical protein
MSGSPDGRITAFPYRDLAAPIGARTERHTTMAYVYCSTAMKGLTIEDFRKVSAEHLPFESIDGLLACTAGSDDKGLNVVMVFESKAHQERYAAEQLFPAFQATGIAPPEGTVVVEHEVDELYIS